MIFLKNQRGFSLTELVVSLGIMSIIGVVTMTYMGESTRFLKIAGLKSDRVADMAQGKNFIYKDFRQAGPSFLFLDQESSAYNLEVPSEFCKKLGDLTYNFWGIQDKETCQGYEITLKDIGDEFSFIKKNVNTEKESAYISPEKAYVINTKTKVVIFKKKLLNDELKRVGLSPDKQTLYKFQAGVNVEDKNSTLLNYAAVYNIEENAIQQGINYTIISAHCEANNIDTIDKFFRCLPPTGIKKVSVIPVTKVTYRIGEIKLTDTKKAKVLQRVTTNNGTDEVVVNMFQNIESIRIYRDKPSTGLISFDVNLPRTQNSMQ